jgi:hypothetical protein
MTTSTATAVRIDTKSTFGRLFAILKIEIRRSLELTGRAYMHGVPPL